MKETSPIQITIRSRLLDIVCGFWMLLELENQHETETAPRNSYLDQDRNPSNFRLALLQICPFPTETGGRSQSSISLPASEPTATTATTRLEAVAGAVEPTAHDGGFGPGQGLGHLTPAGRKGYWPCRRHCVGWNPSGWRVSCVATGARN